MKALRPALVAASAALLAAPPAAASTVPRVDFAGGEIFVAGGSLYPVRGTVDFSADWAREETQSYGLSLIAVPITGAPPGYFRERLPGLWVAAARVTRKWGENDDGMSWGLTVAGGLAPVFAETTATVVPPPNFWFLQPAFVGAWNFRLFGIRSALRGTLGPVLSLGGVGDAIGSGAGGGADFGVAAWLWPNLEFAVRVSPRHELTLGGNGVLGWRTTF
jgi:hypothetical protein